MKDINRTRIYTTKNGVRCLSTWIQGRCHICNRFLSKGSQKYCEEHGKLMKLVLKKMWMHIFYSEELFICGQLRLYSLQSIRDFVEYPLNRSIRVKLIGFV